MIPNTLNTQINAFKTEGLTAEVEYPHFSTLANIKMKLEKKKNVNL